MDGPINNEITHVKTVQRRQHHKQASLSKRNTYKISNKTDKISHLVTLETQMTNTLGTQVVHMQLKHQ